MSKFIIFASARSGSTSLAKVLGESKDVKMAIEPFHPKFSEWNPGARNYSEFVTDNQTMQQALKELFANYTAMKVLDYQFSEEIYKSMLANKQYKILFLKRKKLLSGAISSFVAHQVNEWHKQNNQSIYDNIKPISITQLQEWIDYVGEMNQTYHQYLKDNRQGDFMPLNYEDLYSEDYGQNKLTLSEICKFLDIALPSESSIKQYMTPSKAKINYHDIYKKISNYKEIEEKLGDLN